MKFSLPKNDPLGTDLKIDSNGDIISTLSGSADTVTNADNVAQSIRTNITTLPASYLWGNTVGTDLAKYVDEPITPNLEQLIKTIVLNKVEQDKRITKVENIDLNTTVKDTLIITIYADVPIYGAVQIPIVIGGV